MRNNNRTSVYLAGPIFGCRYSEATRWRTTIAKGLAPHGVEIFDPMRGKSELSQAQTIAECYPQIPGCDARAILARDRFDVQRSDLVIANCKWDPTRQSVGTIIELGWADAWRKPVIMIADPDSAMLRHPMVAGIIGWAVSDERAAIDLAMGVLNVGL